jgi:hypothetical protein
MVVCSLWPGLVHAQAVDDATRRAARNLGVAGVEAYEAQDYANASEKLEKAYQTLKAPSLGLWSARALAKLNKLVEAAERYQEVGRLEISGGDRAVQRQAQADAASELDELAQQVPNLVVKLSGNTDGVSVTIDGATVAPALIGESRPVNPGKHQVRASRGGKSVSAEATVAAGETKLVELEVPAVAPAAAATPAASAKRDDALASRSSASTRRTVGYVALGVGGAGLIVGGIGSALAISKKGEIDDNANCRDNVCRLSESSLVDSYSTWRTLSSAGLIGGVALAGVGAVLVLTAPKTREQTALFVGPDSVTLSRRF